MEVPNGTSPCKVIECSSSSSHSDDIMSTPVTPPSSMAGKIPGQSKGAEPKQKKKMAYSNEHSAQSRNKQSVPSVQGARAHRDQIYIAINSVKKLALPNLYFSNRQHVATGGLEQISKLSHAVRSKKPCFMSFMLPCNIFSNKRVLIIHKYAERLQDL